MVAEHDDDNTHFFNLIDFHPVKFNWKNCMILQASWEMYGWVYHPAFVKALRLYKPLANYFFWTYWRNKPIIISTYLN